MRNPHAEGAGASNRLAALGERPTRKTPEIQRTPADAIALFVPGADETERALRVRIHRARDAATARATHSKHGGARSLFWQAAQLAAMRVFAPLSSEDLKETVDNLARLFLVAGWIERTEAPDAE